MEDYKAFNEILYPNDKKILGIILSKQKELLGRVKIKWQETEMTERTFWKRIQNLEMMELIQVERTSGMSNNYKLTIKGLAALKE